MNNSPELYVLEVRYNFNGKEDVLYPVVLRNDRETVLVDCGYAGFMPLIEKAMTEHGLALKHLTGIIITHHDMDHMGGLAEIRASYPAVKVYTSSIEKDYVEGHQKSLRLQQAEDLYACLPEEHKPGALQFQQGLRSVQPATVDDVLPLNEEIPFLEGVRAIPTPGHMPGHISLYLPEQRTLVAADAVVYENGQFDVANPQYTLDLPAALDSVRRLQQLDIDTMVCYHGGIIKENVPQKLLALADRYSRI